MENILAILWCCRRSSILWCLGSNWGEEGLRDKVNQKGVSKVWWHRVKKNVFVLRPFSLLILFSFSMMFARCGEIWKNLNVVLYGLFWRWPQILVNLRDVLQCMGLIRVAWKKNRHNDIDNFQRHYIIHDIFFMKQVMPKHPFTQTLLYFFPINSLECISTFKTKKKIMKPDAFDFKSLPTFPSTTISTPFSSHEKNTEKSRRLEEACKDEIKPRMKYHTSKSMWNVWFIQCSSHYIVLSDSLQTYLFNMCVCVCVCQLIFLENKFSLLWKICSQ